MEELLIKIQNIVRNETSEIKTRLESVENKVDNMQTNIDELKTDVAELKETTTELKTDVEEVTLNNNFLRTCLFSLENDYFKKIDAIFDYVSLQKELNDIKFENINKTKERVEHNELRILNHEARLEFLENNLNQSV